MQAPSTALSVVKVAEAHFPSAYGRFRIYGFETTGFETGANGGREEAIALKMGNIAAGDPPLVRIHSQCLTGDVFHSLRCDCRLQLELALESIAKDERGLIVYENQEGRGIGLLNKLRAYELQDAGADTVEANEKLGFEADLRSYAMPAEIIRFFGVNKVRLLSNNPDKIAALERAGIEVVERVPALVAPHEATERYLKTKKQKMGHLLD